MSAVLPFAVTVIDKLPPNTSVARGVKTTSTNLPTRDKSSGRVDIVGSKRILRVIGVIEKSALAGVVGVGAVGVEGVTVGMFSTLGPMLI